MPHHLELRSATARLATILLAVCSASFLAASDRPSDGKFFLSLTTRLEDQPVFGNSAVTRFQLFGSQSLVAGGRLSLWLDGSVPNDDMFASVQVRDIPVGKGEAIVEAGDLVLTGAALGPGRLRATLPFRGIRLGLDVGASRWGLFAGGVRSRHVSPGIDAEQRSFLGAEWCRRLGSASIGMVALVVEDLEGLAEAGPDEKFSGGDASELASDGWFVAANDGEAVSNESLRAVIEQHASGPKSRFSSGLRGATWAVPADRASSAVLMTRWVSGGMRATSLFGEATVTNGGGFGARLGSVFAAPWGRLEATAFGFNDSVPFLPPLLRPAETGADVSASLQVSELVSVSGHGGWARNGQLGHDQAYGQVYLSWAGGASRPHVRLSWRHNQTSTRSGSEPTSQWGTEQLGLDVTRRWVGGMGNLRVRQDVNVAGQGIDRGDAVLRLRRQAVNGAVWEVSATTRWQSEGHFGILAAGSVERPLLGPYHGLIGIGVAHLWHG